MKKAVAIIQARLGSTRLPGKVMKKIAGKTVLQHVVERVQVSKGIDGIVIATTTKEEDLLIAKEAERLGVKYYRGSEEDVLARYYYAAKENKADIVVRITSDCPLIDPFVLDNMLSKFCEANDEIEVDYMSNTIQRTFPRGLDAEIFSFAALEKAFNEAGKNYEREHVTPYFYQNPQIFTIIGYREDEDNSEYRLTLDTEEDLLVITQIYEHLYRGERLIKTEEIISFIEKHPEIKAINEAVKQKELGN